MTITYLEEQLCLERNQVSCCDPDPVAAETLTVSQFAELYGVHKHTVLNWIRAGKIRAVFCSHGKYIRYYIPTDTIPPMARPAKTA